MRVGVDSGVQRCERVWPRLVGVCGVYSAVRMTGLLFISRMRAGAGYGKVTD